MREGFIEDFLKEGLGRTAFFRIQMGRLSYERSCDKGMERE